MLIEPTTRTFRIANVSENFGKQQQQQHELMCRAKHKLRVYVWVCISIFVCVCVCVSPPYATLEKRQAGRQHSSDWQLPELCNNPQHTSSPLTCHAPLTIMDTDVCLIGSIWAQLVIAFLAVLARYVNKISAFFD